MKRTIRMAALVASLIGGMATPAQDPAPVDRDGRNARLVEQIEKGHRLDEEQVRRVREILAGSRFIGQGNPAVTRHPATPEECRLKGVDYGDPAFEKICRAPFMAPLYDPARQRPEEADRCIDQFEFPGLPCAYPVVWVRAREAALLCEAVGKRLCDAHEWEGACEGKLEPPDYRFDLAREQAPADAVRRMRQAHNAARAPSKSWSYGAEYRQGVCAAASQKSPGCEGGQWAACGSNTYPAGHFPECRSRLAVYDLNGNAAEHMNLPLDPSQMASGGKGGLGHTEMKGSWFIFDRYRAHDDWCRWRAPYWHGSRVMDANSHHNYHLGFRCCKSLEPKPPPAPSPSP